MKRYIIRMEEGEAFNAASKARKDAEVIAGMMRYEPVVFQGGRTAGGSVSGALRLAFQGMRNWRNLLKKAEPGSMILVQYPFFPVKSAVLFRWVRRLAGRKNLRFIALVHDLDSLRGLHGKAAEYSDRKVLPLFNAVICHNDRMKKYLAEQGVEPEKMVPLGIFDYLTENAGEESRQTKVEKAETGNSFCQSEKGKSFDSYSVAVAGNLSPEKCGYVQELMKMAGEGTFSLHLYGKGLEGSELPPQVHFHGAFPPEELPEKLEGGYGLVWDGPSATVCGGRQGEYLRYNNPHKFSLYMAAGLPVIAWRESALADFVRESGTGLLVESLSDLEKAIREVSPEEYGHMRYTAESIGESVRQGAYLRNALDRAEKSVLKKSPI